MRPIKLKANYVGGAGWKIEALIPQTVNCAEFTMRATFQPLVQMHDDCIQSCIGYEPWIQFAPEEWRDMIGQMFKEMADLWNEKEAAKDSGQNCSPEAGPTKNAQHESAETKIIESAPSCVR